MTGDCQGHEQGNTEYFSPASNYSALTRNFFLKGCFQNEQPLALAYFAECEDIPDPGYLDNETQIPMGPLIFSLQATSILPCFASWCRYFTLQESGHTFKFWTEGSFNPNWSTNTQFSADSYADAIERKPSPYGKTKSVKIANVYHWTRTSISKSTHLPLRLYRPHVGQYGS